MSKTKEIAEYNFTFTVTDSGPPGHNLKILSVLNPIFNRETLSVDDNVLIKDQKSEYYNRTGVIEKIFMLSQIKDKAEILAIRIKKTLVMFKLEQVTKLPPPH